MRQTLCCFKHAELFAFILLSSSPFESDVLTKLGYENMKIGYFILPITVLKEIDAEATIHKQTKQ